MSIPIHHVWPTAALLAVALAGCASAPVEVAAAPPAAPIAVSCQTDSITDQPCIAMARKCCSEPAVDTIRLVLAKQIPADAQTTPKSVYEYQATYTCPGQPIASTE
jgi:Flp pilus assembly protein TadD